MLGRRLPGFAVFLAVLLQEMLKQQRNFRRALPEWRNVDGQYVQPVIQILAETSRFHGFVHFHVGRRQHAHIRLYHVPPAQPGILMILQNVQQFGLQMRAHFRNFVQENRPLVGHLKSPRFRSYRSGERPLFEPEQL